MIVVRNGTVTDDDERPLDDVLGDYTDDAGDEPSHSNKSKATAAANARALDDAVRRVGQRDLARRPGHDPTVRVRRVDPATLAKPSAESTACSDCGIEFLPGEGRWRDPKRHNLLVHTNGGCDRARLRTGARSRAAAHSPRSEEAAMEATATAPAPAEEPTRRSNPILDYLAEHGPSVGGDIAAAIGRATGNVTTRLRQMEEEGRVRRTGRSLSHGRGGPQIEWALADGSEPPACIETPEPARVTAARVRQELAELIRAEDLEQLLEAYCDGIALAEANADTLGRVLRVRRTIELLAEVTTT